MHLFILGMLVNGAGALAHIAVEAGATTALGRRLCTVAGDERLTLVDGKLIVPEHAAFARVVVGTGDCDAPHTITVSVVPAVTRGATGAWVFPDDGHVELHDGPLSRAVIWWRTGGAAWRSEVCVETSAGGDGKPVCELMISVDEARAALEGATLDVLRLPPGAPAPTGSEPPEIWTRASEAGAGGPLPLEALRVPVQRFVLNGPLVHVTSIEAWREQSTLKLAVPRILAAVNCRPAGCWLSDDGSAIIVVPPATGDAVTVSARLKDKIWLRQGEGFVSSTTFAMPLARCQLQPLAKVILGGTEDHRLSLALGDRCPSDLTGLAAETSPPSAAYVEEVAADGRRVEIRLGHVPSRVDTLELKLLRASTRAIVGTAAIKVRSGFASIHVSLVDPQLGELPVIPTNREVRMQWASPDPQLTSGIVPVALVGYYSLRREGTDVFIRGEAKTAGAIPLRFAYVAPESGSDEPLVFFDSDVHFGVRPVNVPVSLAPDDTRTGKLFAVYCRDGARGSEHEIEPGELVSMAFGARGSCRLRVNRSVLTPEDGTQRIKVTVSFTSPTGTTRSGGFSQVLVLSSGGGVDTVWLGSNDQLRAFDHMSVSLAHDDLPGHYVDESEASSLPARRYQMIFGDARLRLYGSATVPTGLYRIVKGKGAGILQFSAGALVRLAFLNQEGREYPFDFEFGLLGTNLSGTADLSIVAGFGLTVPLLNPQEAAQAAIGVHAWAEYSPTRTGKDGRPLAIIFGPSFSFGDFGTNL